LILQRSSNYSPVLYRTPASSLFSTSCAPSPSLLSLSFPNVSSKSSWLVSPRAINRQTSSKNPHRNASTVVPDTMASPTDPSDSMARSLISQGTSLLQSGDLEGARDKFKRSVEIKQTADGYYCLGVVEYQLQSQSQLKSQSDSEKDQPLKMSSIQSSINAFQKSLEIQPLGPYASDAHTNLASAYVLCAPPEPQKALQHLTKAVELSPDDGEIRFNLGAVLEINDQLEAALREYKKAEEFGIKRAAQNVRNVGAKLLRLRMEELRKQNEKASISKGEKDETEKDAGTKT